MLPNAWGFLFFYYENIENLLPNVHDCRIILVIEEIPVLVTKTKGNFDLEKIEYLFFRFSALCICLWDLNFILNRLFIKSHHICGLSFT